MTFVLKHPLIAALGLLLVAASLPLGFLQYRTTTVRVYSDHIEPTIVANPIFNTRDRIIDLACVAGVPCRGPRAISEVNGVYPRGSLPMAAGVLGGIALPFFLTGFALFL